MIEKPTVLILGAGASIPYGYPSGAQLIKNIIRRLAVDGPSTTTHTRNELLELGFMSNHIDAFIADLLISKVRSIDEFLEHRKDYREIGKITIAQAIIGCEKRLSSHEYLIGWARDPERDISEWHSLLLAALSCERQLLKANKLSIITFNYDRSLEHYLYEAWMAKYGDDARDEIIDAIKAFDIVHVHGKLGNLPWEGGTHIRGYGDKKSIREIEESGKLISILYEGDRQSLEFERAKAKIAASKRVVFLGFGYHTSNLRRLGVDALPPDAKQVLGTRYGVENLEAYHIASRYPALKLLRVVPSVGIKEFLRQVVNLDGEALWMDI